jgi:CheY-like chemotaxis protein
MDGIPFSILLADDDEDDRMIIDEAFKHINYAAGIKKFINGEAMLHYLEQIEPSLYPSVIVLDNTMPKMDAVDLLSILKKNPKYEKIPVVVYTSALSEHKKEQLLAMGAYACLEKGALMDDIVEVAKQLKTMAENPKKSSST